MRELFTRLRASQLVRYIFIGGISYVIELAVLLSLANLLLLPPEIAVACSFWVGLIASFLMQKYIAFNNRASDKSTIGKQTVIYCALVLFNYSFTIVFVSVFTSFLGLIAARTVALLFTTFWNFFIYKKIFKDKQESQQIK